MNLTKRQKLIRAVPGIIVGSIMIGIVTWGISSDKKCKVFLEKDNCIQKMVFCKYSKKGLRGSGIEVSTGFVSQDDTILYFTTSAFIKPIPVGFPIIVRYSPECTDCSRFLWDSIVVHNGHRIKYFHVKNQGIDYEISKIGN